MKIWVEGLVRQTELIEVDDKFLPLLLEDDKSRKDWNQYYELCADFREEMENLEEFEEVKVVYDETETMCLYED